MPIPADFIGPLEYNDAIERLAEEYAPKMRALLERVRDACRDAGMHTGEPFDMSSDDYRWNLSVWRVGADSNVREDSIDITVEIAEADQYEGDSARGGLNFGLDIVEWGGRMLGGLTPYNYTEQCWVPMGDSGAVAERWQILEDADVSTIPELCEG